MPCNCDYLEPTEREREIARAAKLIVYVRRKQGKEPEKWALLASDMGRVGADKDKCVAFLCELIRGMSDVERERIVYNAHDSISRNLAGWWERHLKADKARGE